MAWVEGKTETNGWDVPGPQDNRSSNGVSGEHCEYNCFTINKQFKTI